MLIFKPDFNKPFDDFYDLISNYNLIMFSDFDNLDISFKLFEAKLYNKNYKDTINKSSHFIKKSKFNKPIILHDNVHLQIKKL